MALLICSNETNITTFQEPSLRNEGTNLRREGRKATGNQHYVILDNQTERRGGGRSSPFVEGSGPFFGQHGPGAVDGALVLARWGVHVPGLDHVHGRGDDRGDEAGAERRNKVAGQVVCGD